MNLKRNIFWSTFILTLLFDQLSKYFILRSLSENQSIAVIKNIFHITLVKNTGVAFGLFKGTNKIVFITSSIALIAFIIAYFFYKKPGGLFLDISFGLISAGAFGNLIDRLTYGKVIDFFDFRVWPVFNIADSSIVVGIFIMILFYTVTDEKLPVKSLSRRRS